jgi:NDP-sugar pyrophosphorylase family protein
VLPQLVKETLTPFRFEGWWSDAGTLSNYLQAQHLLLAASRAKIASEADVTAGTLRPPVYVSAGCFVEGRLGPDVVLGKACKVGRATVTNATFLEGVSVDDKADIGSSIIGAGSAIGEGALVRDSILGDGVQISPHEKVVDARVTA